MTNANLILQYLVGMIVIGAAINMPAWAQLVYTRIVDPERTRCWYSDAYILTRLGMVLHGPAVATAYAYWGITHYLAGDPPIEPFAFYVTTRGLIALAEACFIRGAYLFGSKRAGTVWIAMTAGWTLICLLGGIEQ